MLYGSMATGRHGIGSDVDILVVADGFPSNPIERLRILFQLNPTAAPIEPVGYTPREFLRMLERRHPTALDAMAEGKPLYDDGFLEQAKQVFKWVKEKFGLVRTPRGWKSKVLWQKASR